MTTTAHRSYSRQVIAAWLHGYTTGHAVGRHEGRVVGFAEGYDAGHGDGIPAGARLADLAASAKWAAYLPQLRTHRPRTRHPHGPAKPLPTPTECLATWPAPAAPATASRRLAA